MMNQQYVQTTWTPIQNNINPSNSNKINKNVLIIGGVIIALIVLALSVIFVPKILGTGDNIQAKYSDRFIMAMDMDEKVLYLAEKKGNYYKAIMEVNEIDQFFGYFDNKLVIGEGSEIKYADTKAENKEFKTLLTMPKYCDSTNTTCVSQTILHMFGYKKRLYFQSVREDPKDEENILCDLSYIKEGQDYDDRQVVLSGINCLAVINYDEKRNIVYYLTDDETPVLKSFNLKNNKEKELARSVKAFDFNGKDELIYYQANTFKLYNLKNNMITTLFNDEYANTNNIFSLSFLDDYLYYSTYDIENANELLKTYNLETKEDKVIADDIWSLGLALRSLYGKKVNVNLGYGLSYAIDGELIRNKEGLEKLEVTLETAMKMGYKKVWAIFQPFTYSRTAILFDEFVRVLRIPDKCIMTEIMGSREVNTYNIYTSQLAEKIPDSVWFNTQEEVADYVVKNAKAGDLVLTMGCGDIYKSAFMMIERLKNGTVQ